MVMGVLIPALMSPELFLTLTGGEIQAGVKVAGIGSGP